MIAFPSGAWVWLVGGVTDMRKGMNGLTLLVQEARLAARQADVAPLVGGLEAWMRGERARLSRHAPVAKAMNYMLKRWCAFARFLEDGRICLTNNAAERALRGVALGRKALDLRRLRSRRRSAPPPRQSRPSRPLPQPLQKGSCHAAREDR